MSQRILDTGNQIMVDRPSNSVPSNFFDLSHDVKLSCNMGKLIPISCMEVVPGDKYSIKTESLIRFQPMIAPMMHRVNVRSEWFFVATRLLWPNWENFISPPSVSSVAPAAPYFQSVENPKGGVGDYLGLPITDPLGVVGPPLLGNISALPHAAFDKLRADWYRDEDLETEEDFTPLVDGDNSSTYEQLNVVKSRNWDRDYFTSAKPFAQKGPAVQIPLGTANPFPDVPIHGVGAAVRPVDGDWPFTGNVDLGVTIASSNIGALHVGDGTHPDEQAQIGVIGTAETSLLTPDIIGGTIEELRRAEALQKFLEADSRGGTRYIETIKQHFGVRSSDSRLQRAEYIGSTFQPLVISEVLNTTGTDTAAQGTMAGHGVSTGHGSTIHYAAEEHGFIIGVMSVLPVTGYSQGIHRMWSRTDRLDYLWPEFAHLGEQPVLNKELYANTIRGDDTFGYLPRYSEYRFLGNRVAGDFRTNLDFWHMSRLFSDVPLLNSEFLKCDATDRIFAVTDPTVDHVLCHWFHKIKCLRKLPRYVVPSI